MTLNMLPVLDGRRPSVYVPKSKKHVDKLNSLDGFYIGERFKFKHNIGAGTFGLIYLVEDIYNGNEFAAKITLTNPPILRPKDIKGTKRLIKNQLFEYFNTRENVDGMYLNLEYVVSEGVNVPFLKETALHLKVHSHPNIITIHNVINIDNFAIVTIMDYYEQGDLFENIINKSIFTYLPYCQDKQLLMKNTLLQLIDAITYCRDKGIYHCDLKPENIMVRYNRGFRRTTTNIINYNEIKIVLIDFGLAMDSDLISCDACRGSSFYMAPERIVNYTTNLLIKSMIDLGQYQTATYEEGRSMKYFPTLAGDIWSIGVLCLNIVCSRNPWPVASMAENADNKIFRSYILGDHCVLRSILPISNSLSHILNCVFRLNPNDRISLSRFAQELVACNFFSDEPVVQQLQTPNESDEEYDSSEKCSYLKELRHS